MCQSRCLAEGPIWTILVVDESILQFEIAESPTGQENKVGDNFSNPAPLISEAQPLGFVMPSAWPLREMEPEISANQIPQLPVYQHLLEPGRSGRRAENKVDACGQAALFNCGDESPTGIEIDS